jgi:hypothetical protein
MFKHKVTLSLLTFGLVLGILLFLSWVSLSQQKLIAYDTKSYDPYGLKAVGLLLQKSGYSVIPINRLPADHQQLVVIVTTAKLPVMLERKLLHWIASGGTLIELTSAQPSLNRYSHHFAHLNTKGNQQFTTEYQPLAGLTYHIKNDWVTTAINPEQGFYGSGNQYFIYRQSIGSGSLISWNDIEGLTNRHLKMHPDNAVIFATLIQAFASSHQVGFYNLAFITDESSFNPQTGEFLSHYYGAGLLFFIGIILLIWKLAARFGRPRPLILAQGRSYDEFVYSMANLFQQAKIQQMVLDNLWRDLLKIIAALTQLPVDTAPDLLIARLNMITGRHYDPILSLYPQGNRLAKNLPKQQFLMVALKLDAYRKELKEWRKSSHFVTR